MSEEQKLNSLERFRKSPGRLILEQHSHCEVPAGCGGVVLRWRNPMAAIPLTLHYYTPGNLRLFLDDVEITTGRPDVAPGPHVLGLILENVDWSTGLFLMVLHHEPRNAQTELPSLTVEPPFALMTAGDGTWQFSFDFTADDADWQPLVQTATPTLNDRDSGAYRCRQCTDQGAVCLGLPKHYRKRATGTVHIRKSFVIPLPEERPT